MGNVVYMADRKPIPPKIISGTHAGQKYTCTFDPNAPPHERWVWQVDFTVVYKFYGSSPTPEAATVQARKRIHKLTQRQQLIEENE